MLLPKSDKALISRALDIVETCRASQSARSSLYQTISNWTEMGRGDSNKSLCNTLYHHVDRLSSHLFSPTELRFTVDFETPYDKLVLAQGELASRILTRQWEQKNLDLVFGSGVLTGTQFGAAIIKQTWTRKGVKARLLMPWQFGVYREDINDLYEQEAMVETSLITMHEAYRRVSHLPDAQSLMKRIAATATNGPPGDASGPSSYFHQILSTSVLQTTDTQVSGKPGGIVDMGQPARIIRPEVDIPLVKYHEIWVVDEEIDDYCTIQLIEPDILIFPTSRRRNLCGDNSKIHPYTLVQPNFTPGYFWGRSEIMDLMEPQGLLSELLQDTRRLMGMQFDKLIAFVGDDGMTDEKYSQFRGSGYVSLAPGASATDLTPKLPDATFTYITLISKMMEQISGFDNILSGQGESGVRAGVHADTLVRTASPRLRDRSLLVERQCADAADRTLELMEIHDDRAYHSGDPKAPTEFFLKLLPEDRRVTVDSHSSSPIYENDHKELISFGVKHGFIDGESAIDMLPLPMKDKLKLRFREAQDAKAKMIQEHPEILTRGKKQHV
jgi:hypothetical protein